MTYSANSQSLADYVLAICAKSFGSAPAAEAPYLAENVTAMTKMMIDMKIRPSGDVDTDFVAMMVPHHRGAIEMALTKSVSVLSEEEYEFLDFMLTESSRPVTWLALLNRDDQPEACLDTLRQADSLIRRARGE